MEAFCLVLLKDIYQLFADDLGNYISGPTFGTAGDEEAWDMDLTNDGGYVMTGTAIGPGPGYSAVYVIKSNGSVVNSNAPCGVSNGKASGGYFISKVKMKLKLSKLCANPCGTIAAMKRVPLTSSVIFMVVMMSW